MVRNVIFGCEGHSLTADEKAFFSDTNPWGFILFRRNCETAEQTRILCTELRTLLGRNVPILIDHEGGRVSRLSPHIVPKRVAMGEIGALVEKAGLDKAEEAARTAGEILGRDSRLVGCNVNCAPMIDVRQPGAHDIVGDRAFSEDPEIVAKLGRALADGLIAGGCLPIAKHIPGHGRAMCDSHLDLPRVCEAEEVLDNTDFAPFRALNDIPLGMTAHIVYEAVDADQPATLSSKVIDDIIRGQIGFDGLLMTDDLSMKALTGSFTERAEGSLKAGCDLVLHCNGDMAEMVAVAIGCGPLSAEAERRSEKALSQLREPSAIEMAKLEERFASLMEPSTLS
ncbi:beta-N-acetylhexosaminidase [Parvularcula marina]|uniref:beta-N-acetylhexosaminidase n=1 Tax=Parvularcula marina TaxID=2292771 RepID=UPI003516514A